MRSNIISKMLESISQEERDKYSKQVEEELKFLEELNAKGHKWNTNTSYSLVKMEEIGIRPIGICCLMCEETFIFDTKEEANNAYEICEKGGIVSGWWYSKEDFEEYLPIYEKDFNSKVNVYWL